VETASQDVKMVFSKDGRWTNIVQVGGTASTMGLHIVSATVVGLAFGYYLDDYFGTKPWLIMIFFVLGVVAGFKMVIEDFRKLQRREEARRQRGSLKQNGDDSAGEDQSEG
jgi:ATP synthase protein I